MNLKKLALGIFADAKKGFLMAADPLFGLPDVSAYCPGERPRRERVKVEPEGKAKGRVRDGKERTDFVDENGASVTVLGPFEKRPRTVADVVLDEYDKAFLRDEFGANYDAVRAKIMKWHWQNEHSADAIERAHRTTGGKLEDGYGSRTAATFIKTFYLADDRRDEDGKTRLREKRQSPAAQNHVEW